MRFFRINSDEVLVTDGKSSVLIMAQVDDGAYADNLVVELEGHGAAQVCKGCPKAGIVFWGHCEDCPKEVEPR